MSIKDLVDRIIEDGKMTKAEHAEFLKAIREDGSIDSEEMEQVKRLKDLIDSGALEVVD
jgi:polyhydroxyalkanoate synthesis regulator phasin